MNKKLRHIASAFVVTGFLFIAFGSDDEQTTIEADIATLAPAVTVSAKQLYADYDANGIAADEKYKDKVLLVTGQVNTIDRDIFDEIYVSLKGDEYFGDIECYFADTHVKTASQLSKGQTVTVKGKCDGKKGIVTLKGCVIESNNPEK